jgi:hypothetical protein
MHTITRRETLRGLLATPVVSLTSKPPFVSFSTAVDLALVLATDVSGSISPEEWEIQRQGYAEAFRSKEVIEAIQSGFVGKIAVTLMEWAPSISQVQAVGWSVLDGKESSFKFADAIEKAGRLTTGGTSISGAISFATMLLLQQKYLAGRLVLDISGDGVENNPSAADAFTYVGYARQAALRYGITINGLPILSPTISSLDTRQNLFTPKWSASPLAPPQEWKIMPLDDYYREYVIGGPNAFVVPALSGKDFPEAIRRKLVFEIAGLTPSSRSA